MAGSVQFTENIPQRGKPLAMTGARDVRYSRETRKRVTISTFFERAICKCL